MNQVLVKNLSYQFSKNNILFQDISFEVNEGDIFGIYGQNGAGKSTLLKLIGGLLRPQILPNKKETNKIDLILHGNRIELNELTEFVSYVAPYYNIYEDFTLIELIEILAKIRNNGKIKLIQTNAIDLMNDFKLYNKRNHKIKSYSSGMKQRCKIILGLLNDSPFYFFDEFSTNLDKEGSEITKTKIIELQQNRKVILIATNESHEKEICNKFIEIN